MKNKFLINGPIKKYLTKMKTEIWFLGEQEKKESLLIYKNCYHNSFSRMEKRMNYVQCNCL